MSRASLQNENDTMRHGADINVVNETNSTQQHLAIRYRLQFGRGCKQIVCSIYLFWGKYGSVYFET